MRFVKRGLTVKLDITPVLPMPPSADALARAIALFDRQLDFAAAITALCGEDRRVSSQAVSQWKESGVPEDRCEPIETVTNGQVRVEDLRPDIQWFRDPDGRVISYVLPPVAVTSTAPVKKRRRPKA